MNRTQKRFYLTVLALFVGPEIGLLLYMGSLGGWGVVDFQLFLRFVLEGIGAGALGLAMLSLARRRWALGAFSLFWLMYLAVLVAQAVSYAATFAFIPRMALENAEHVSLMVDARSVTTIIAGVAVFAIGLALALSRAASARATRIAGLLMISGICVPLDGLVKYIFAARQVQAASWIDKLRNQHPPLRSIAISIGGSMGDRLAKQANIDRVLGTGLVARPFGSLSRYPFVKNEIYSSPPPFGSAKKRPNLLVIFFEGLSARTIGAYDASFKDLTPNLDAFARDPSSMKVLNYFNHTAPTFRGLLGQLCSLHGRTIPNSSWRSKKQARYFCLANLMKLSGYSASFLDPHFRDEDHLSFMLQQLGFDEVLTADSIKEFFGNPNPVKHHYALTNQDLFAGLLGFIEKKSAEEAPFFVATYPFQTHAWLDTLPGGVKYRDGRNPVLNTILDADTQFGLFWERFRKLKVAQNTVVIVTSDHARFPEKDYLNALIEAGVDDYEPFFVDRIPLVIHDPTREVPSVFDAKFSSSLHLVPTIAHFLGLPNKRHSFLGTSIFERNLGEDVASFGDQFLKIQPSGIADITDSNDPDHQAIREIIRSIRELERRDRIWSE